MQKRYALLIAGVLLAFSAPQASAEVQTLDQALSLAYQNNPALQAERAKLRAIDEQVAEAESGWRPSLDGKASAGQQYQNPPLIVGGEKTLDQRAVGVTLKQNIFNGFKTVAGVRAAKAKVKSQQELLQSAEQQLLLDAGTVFLNVVRDQSMVDLTRGNEDVLRKQLEATNDRYKVGEVTLTDVSQAQSRLQRATAGRIQAEGALATSRATFARLVGDMPLKLAQPKLDLVEPKTLEEAIARAEKANPLVLSAQHEIDAARERVSVSEAALLPEINIVGSSSLGWEQSVMVTGQQDTSAIMAELTIPLYRGGADYARTRAAKETVTQVKLQLEEARHRAREAAITAWQALQTARAGLASDRAQIEASELAHRGVVEESKVGTRTVLDVLNAEQEWLDARVALVKDERDEAVAVLQSRSAMGLLTASALDLSVPNYNPKTHAEETSGKWIGFGDVEE